MHGWHVSSLPVLPHLFLSRSGPLSRGPPAEHSSVRRFRLGGVCGHHNDDDDDDDNDSCHRNADNDPRELRRRGCSVGRRSIDREKDTCTDTDRQADAHLPPVAGELLVELFCFLAKFFGIPGHYSGLLNGKFRLFAQHRHIVDRVG